MADPINTGAVPRRCHVGEEQDLGDQIVVTTGDSRYLILEATAPELWRLVDGRRSVEELIETCVRRYAGDRAEIAGDVVATIGQWQRAGIVEIDGQPRAGT